MYLGGAGIGSSSGPGWFRCQTRSADSMFRCLPSSCSGLLGITDLRRDTRIEFVGGMRGLSELERRVDSGEMAVAFAMYPTQMADLMAVADAGQVMPPKSTWFEPKLADGLVSLLLDPAEGSAGRVPEH
jgi:hypothetical protein